jgi:hypothetical protein
MMKKAKLKFALDQPATYQIKMPGYLAEGWSDWRRDDDYGRKRGRWSAGYHPDRQLGNDKTCTRRKQ